MLQCVQKGLSFFQKFLGFEPLEYDSNPVCTLTLSDFIANAAAPFKLFTSDNCVLTFSSFPLEKSRQAPR